MDELMARYPGKIRWVMKHTPGSYHPRALPATLLAIEAHAQKGDRVYWEIAHRLLAGSLEESALTRLALEYGLDLEAYRATRARGTHATLQEDEDQALDLEANGTPHFFVNGRRVAGAQPLQRFEAMVLAELALSERLRARGVPESELYQAIMEQAFTPPGLVKVPWVRPGAELPSLGPIDAPVVVQMFSDFECAFCQRVMPTIRELQRRYPEQVCVVWRHLPLAFHPRARLAAHATIEAHAQHGDGKFWEFADALFTQNERGLDTASLVAVGKSLGLDARRLELALVERRHEAIIRRDEAAAMSAGVQGTPGFVINGYQLFGAQPLHRFERLVRLALSDLGKKPSL
jgi:protein-disulfide isomerase